ncbi:MAG: hypothetical protein MOGMAGMI_00999 [Candidatus Omnitrophica bacterium]|nr:hypothetical protein [Candidatus Omnitrophota bacterium]
MADLNGHRRAGFTLLELLIAVIVLVVLVGLALPIFTNTAERSRRAEALNMLNASRQAQLRFFIQNNTYTNNMAQLDFNPNANPAGQTPHFTYGITSATATTFTMTATRNATNGGDGVSTVTINEAGNVGGTGVFA